MLGAIAFLHQRLGIAVLAFAVILGLWGGFQLLTRRGLSGGFRSSYLIMVGLTGIQGLAGIGSFVAGGHPRELLHVVYGVFAFLFLPGVYTYATGRSRDTEAAILTIACWVVLIAFARGFTTGS